MPVTPTQQLQIMTALNELIFCIKPKDFPKFDRVKEEINKILNEVQ